MPRSSSKPGFYYDYMNLIMMKNKLKVFKPRFNWEWEEAITYPKFREMGPDLSAMLNESDGALLIGDRALIAARDFPELVKLDLGAEWTNETGFPMVFGVFAARKDSPKPVLIKASNDMIKQYDKFLSDTFWRSEVIGRTSKKLGFTKSRISEYFSVEVQNKLDDFSKEGLEFFLKEVCQMKDEITWLSDYE